jgi:hypothetical protein
MSGGRGRGHDTPCDARPGWDWRLHRAVPSSIMAWLGDRFHTLDRARQDR